MEKYGRTGQATDDNMAHALCVLDDEGCRHTLRICNTYCFSTATMVARTHVNVTLYILCLSFLHTSIFGTVFFLIILSDL